MTVRSVTLVQSIPSPVRTGTFYYFSSLDPVDKLTSYIILTSDTSQYNKFSTNQRNCIKIISMYYYKISVLDMFSCSYHDTVFNNCIFVLFYPTLLFIL